MECYSASMQGSSNSRIILAGEGDLAAVQSLWDEYWGAFALPADFQNFSDESRTLPGAYALPKGRLLLALVGDSPAGTAALRPLGEFACEAKRMYVRPAYRGQGIATSLLERLVKEARGAGYKEMYGDTLKTMGAALEWYFRLGFREVGPYSPNPTPDAIYLRLSLTDESRPSLPKLQSSWNSG